MPPKKRKISTTYQFKYASPEPLLHPIRTPYDPSTHLTTNATALMTTIQAILNRTKRRAYFSSDDSAEEDTFNDRYDPSHPAFDELVKLVSGRRRPRRGGLRNPELGPEVLAQGRKILDEQRRLEAAAEESESRRTLSPLTPLASSSQLRVRPGSSHSRKGVSADPNASSRSIIPSSQSFERDSFLLAFSSPHPLDSVSARCRRQESKSEDEDSSDIPLPPPAKRRRLSPPDSRESTEELELPPPPPRSPHKKKLDLTHSVIQRKLRTAFNLTENAPGIHHCPSVSFAAQLFCRTRPKQRTSTSQNNHRIVRFR